MGRGAASCRLSVYVGLSAAQSSWTISHHPTQAWRPGHWCSWMFTIGDFEYNDTAANFTFSAGAFQGSRGADNAEGLYMENIFEELDAPAEWFYDEAAEVSFSCVEISEYTP
jgi:hypothetical protein